MKFIKKNNDKESFIELDFYNEMIESLSDFDDFDCGDDSLNKYMYKCINEDAATLHGLYDKATDKLIGVCFLRCTSYVEKKKINYIDDGFGGSEIDPENPIDCELLPAIEILYFAIDKNYQNLKIVDEEMKGCLSSLYLLTMFDIIAEMSETFSKVQYVILYSVKSAIEFYDKCGFSEFEKTALVSSNEQHQDCIPMYVLL